jgi:acyl-CoA reductase-like NAD-dependent aldehyde dehydrogenase
MAIDSDFSMTIDGKAVTTSDKIDVVNPATEEAFAQAPSAGKGELNRAVAAAQRAFASWKETSWEERGRLVNAFGDALEAQAEDFMRLLTLEQGKPRAGGEFEVIGGAMWCRIYPSAWWAPSRPGISRFCSRSSRSRLP